MPGSSDPIKATIISLSMTTLLYNDIGVNRTAIVATMSSSQKRAGQKIMLVKLFAILISFQAIS